MKLISCGKPDLAARFRLFKWTQRERPGLTSQSMKVMKLTFFLLTAAFLQVSGRGLSQQVTLSFKDAPVEKVFREIERQTGYGFLYTKKMLQELPKVTLNVKNATIEQVLSLCLGNEALEYTIENRTIVIRKKQVKQLSLTGNEWHGPIDITGKITDADGNPLTGANVKIKGTNIGTTADGQGIFQLKGINENAVLEISFVGFATVEVPV